jgi:hypothetical protein
MRENGVYKITQTFSENLGKHQFSQPFCSNKLWHNGNAERILMDAGLKTLEASTCLHPAIFLSNPLWPMTLGTGFTPNMPVNTTATWLKGNIRKNTGGGIITAWGRCGGG